ncbi:MAG: amidase, partial [Rhizobium pusense]|nr:amidase [Agrobacterium pusense]
MEGRINAFVPGPRSRVPGRSGGPLSGLTFAVKDLFDVAGAPTGGGNHDWAKANPIPDRHAWAVQTLLDAGAELVGKTSTDEVSLGILGENAFDGTPLNTAAPDRVPGGSSSGSAAAVAAGLCDTALGTDTGGSMRVPGSFCGLYSIRPTHGRIDLTGLMPQAPSSDTAGWFTRDAATFARVGAALLGEAPGPLPTKLLVAVDAFGFADPEVAEALQPMVERLAGALGATPRDEIMAPQGLSVWARAQRSLQPVEAWQTFRPWIERDNPRMAFTVAAGLIAGSQVPVAEQNWAALMREEARAR